MESSPSSAFAAAARATDMLPLLLDTPVAVTTIRSGGAGVLRAAWTTLLDAGASLAAGAGVLTGLEAGLAATAGLVAAAVLAGAALAVGLAATVFAAGFFAVNLGFSTFFGLAGFAAARLVGMFRRSKARIRKGARLQDA